MHSCDDVQRVGGQRLHGHGVHRPTCTCEEIVPGEDCPSPQLIVTENVPGVRASLNEATAPVNEVLTSGAIGMSEGVIAGVTTVEGVLVEDVLVLESGVTSLLGSITAAPDATVRVSPSGLVSVTVTVSRSSVRASIVAPRFRR